MYSSQSTPNKVELARTMLTTAVALLSFVAPPTLHLNSMLAILMKDVSEILGLTRTSKSQELKEFGEYVERVIDQVVSALRNDRLASRSNVLKNLEELQKTLCSILDQIKFINASGGLMPWRWLTSVPEEDYVDRMRQQLDDAMGLFRFGALVELLAGSSGSSADEAAANPRISLVDGSQPHNLSVPPTEDHSRTNEQQSLQAVDSDLDSRSSNPCCDIQARVRRAGPPRMCPVTPRRSGSEDRKILVARMKVDRCRRSLQHSRSPTQKRELSVALDCLTDLLVDAGRTREALAANQESVELLKSLAEARIKSTTSPDEDTPSSSSRVPPATNDSGIQTSYSTLIPPSGH